MTLPVNLSPFKVRMGGCPARVDLRAATEDDRAFCHSLYTDCMRPLLGALGAWDAHRGDAAFEEYFDVEEVRIIQLNDRDVGYLQVSEAPDELNLDQLHLLSSVRCHGIGTRLIKQVIASARDGNRTLKLVMVKGNRAETLYRQLGFRLAAECATRRYMEIVP